ncbi:MAG: hypothetical protein ACRCS3_03605 [Paracoccaceae bacterium]
MHRFLLLAAFAALASCGAVVPSTVAMLSRLDPLTADPGAIEVALILPPGIAIAPGSANLSLTATRGDQTVDEAFALTPTPLRLEGYDMPEGATSQLFRIADSDLARMRAVQARIGAWKAEDPSGTNGSFAVSAGGCGLDQGPAPDATATILIRTAKDGPLLPLVRDAGLRALLGPELFDAITPCTTAQ